MSECAVIDAPLVPADCDLRDYQFMPMDVSRLRDSTIVDSVTGDEFRAAVLLWCASWHQIPAASLPDDDIQLAKFAGYGRVVKEWLKVKDGALHGFIKCSDGRLYHPVVAEKACDAWLGKRKSSAKGKAGAIKRWGEKSAAAIVTQDETNATAIKTDSTGIATAITKDGITDSNRQGEGEEKKEPSLRSDSSAELSQAPAQPSHESEIPVITIPTNKTGEEYPVLQYQVAEFQELYPAVEIVSELKKMRGWALGNPKKRKTLGGMLRFITNWLARAQDRPHPESTQPAPNGEAEATPEQLEILKRGALREWADSGKWRNERWIGPPPDNPQTRITPADIAAVPEARMKLTESRRGRSLSARWSQ